MIHSPMSYVIGIDLGTTNSCVAVVENGTPVVIANKHGYRTTPSVVAVTQAGERLVGQIARRQAVTNPTDTAYATKRLIGRDFRSDEVEAAQSIVPYRLVGGRTGDVRVVLQDKEYSIPEIAAMILQEMRIVAEDYLGEDVDQAVVTVPAYFSDSQRQAVRDAGLIAGLDVLRIINEPTAAAIAYGFARDGDRTLAVYDLGGGTFDVSIVKVGSQGSFRVLATTGDSFLGGEDFDERIVEWLIEAFQAEHDVDLRTDAGAMQRLKQAAQKAKCELSSELVADIQLPFLVAQGPSGPLNMHYTISREQLEGLTADLVERTIEICAHALAHAKLPAGVDEVVLVGGQTRMPAVARAVAEHFGHQPSKAIPPGRMCCDRGRAPGGGARRADRRRQPGGRHRAFAGDRGRGRRLRRDHSRQHPRAVSRPEPVHDEPRPTRSSQDRRARGGRPPRLRQPPPAGVRVGGLASGAGRGGRGRGRLSNRR